MLYTRIFNVHSHCNLKYNVYTCVHVHVPVCVYINLYIHVHVHLYIHVYSILSSLLYLLLPPPHTVSCSIIQMFYYGRNDISLGDFLKRYCFRPDYRCQTCSSEMTKHQRHIIHGTSSLHISVQQLDTTIPRSNDGIFTWLACKHCTLVCTCLYMYNVQCIHLHTCACTCTCTLYVM